MSLRLRRPALRLAVATALASACETGPPDPLELPFEGPGRLVVLWELPRGNGEIERVVALYDEDEVRRLELPSPRSVRFAGAEALVVSFEVRDSDDPQDWGRAQLALVDATSGALRAFGPVRRWFDAEPSADGRRLAVGVQLNDSGDSALELWSLGLEPERLTLREESLDRPRFSPDGVELVAARAVQSEEDEAGVSSLAVAGVSVPFPRMFRLRHDLVGSAREVDDGAEPGLSAPQGSVPLWWSERGIYARQGNGLARCAPGGGCELVYEPEGDALLFVDARRFGEGEAFVVLVDRRESDERAPNAIARLDLQSGELTLLLQPRPGLNIADLDWAP